MNEGKKSPGRVDVNNYLPPIQVETLNSREKEARFLLNSLKLEAEDKLKLSYFSILIKIPKTNVLLK